MRLAWRGMALAIAALPAVAAGQPMPKPDRGGVPDSDLYDYGVMGPPATSAIVEAARAAVVLPPAKGPFAATWPSIAEHYRTPAWFLDAKFGIFMHWGVYSAAAHHNEWYEKHMYGADRAWHAEHFGPQERVGYKDLIPLFTAARWDPDAWASLFKAAGARFVMPTAQHHDNFALWDSKVTPFNAVRMGPKRDLIGDLAAAVRRQGMKFGVSNHGVENFTFINPAPELDARLKAASADLYDPAWRDFYNVADRSPAAMTRFLTDWVNRNVELIDKYRPDLLWFDNGANLRVLDPLKTQVAAYYYNRARQWRRQVSISTKFVAYAPSNDDTRQIGSIVDFEKVGKRSPSDIRPGPWMVDDTIGSTWGYTDGMTVGGPGQILARFVDTVAKGGTYLLNISPMADGTIPIGNWLHVNGEAIYGTRPWVKFGEGSVRFTRRGGKLYAIALAWPEHELRIAALGAAAGRITRVELLGVRAPLRFTQDTGGLRIELPAQRPAGLDHAYSFRISGVR